MKKSFAILFGFIVLGLLDSLLASSMPADITYQHTSVIWHWTFIALLVFVRDKPWMTRLLVGLLTGILFDYLFNDSFPFCFFFYGLAALAIGWLMQISDGNKMLFAGCLLLCFLLDFLPYLWQKMTGVNAAGLVQWLYCMQSMTLITDMACIAVVMYIDLVMVRFFLIQKHLIRKEEKKELRRARLARGGRMQ